MHGAPSVSYPVGRSPWAAALGLLAWSLGAATLLAWAASGAGTSRLGVALAACVGAGALAWAGWWRHPAGLLGWTRPLRADHGEKDYKE